MKFVMQGMGVSRRVADWAAIPQRESTQRLYQCHWALYHRWARRNDFLPLQPTLNDLASYLIYLFETVGLQPSTIAVHKAAIASVLRHTQLDFDVSSDQILCNLMKRFHLERPRRARIAPRWDLALVMKQLLAPPFVDATGLSDNGVSTPWFTRKAVFLLALASGARASEIHALSRSEPLFSISPSPNGEVLVVKPFPGFLPKNALPSAAPRSWHIPSFAHLFPGEVERLLCPVRTIKYYRRRTARLAGSRQRLFVHPNVRIADIKRSHISAWIVDVVKEAYDRAEGHLSDVHPTAHEVRALAHSWAYFNNVSLAEVLEGARWRSSTSFIDHYLRDVARSVDGMSGLPLIAAQRLFI